MGVSLMGLFLMFGFLVFSSFQAGGCWLVVKTAVHSLKTTRSIRFNLSVSKQQQWRLIFSSQRSLHFSSLWLQRLIKSTCPRCETQHQSNLYLSQIYMKVTCSQCDISPHTLCCTSARSPDYIALKFLVYFVLFSIFVAWLAIIFSLNFVNVFNACSPLCTRPRRQSCKREQQLRHIPVKFLEFKEHFVFGKFTHRWG